VTSYFATIVLKVLKSIIIVGYTVKTAIIEANFIILIGKVIKVQRYWVLIVTLFEFISTHFTKSRFISGNGLKPDFSNGFN